MKTPSVTIALLAISLLCHETLFGQDGIVLDIPVRDVSSEQIVDDTAIETSFEFQKTQFQIVRSKSGLLAADSLKTTTLDYYVTPFLSWEPTEIQASFDKKRALPAALHGKQLYSMTMTFQLINDEVKCAAAQKLNELRPRTVTSINQILLIPFKFLALSAKIDGNWVRLRSFPNVQLLDSQVVTLSAVPTEVECTIIGDEDTLRTFSKAPDFKIQYITSGFTVKQNILTFALHQVVQQGFHHFLSGDAKFEDLQQYVNSSGAAALNLGAIVGAAGNNSGFVRATGSSFVSRDQVKKLVNVVSERLRSHHWVEDGRVSMDTLKSSMIQQLLDRAKTVEVEIKSEGNRFVIDPKVEKDIAPDVYSSLNSRVGTLGKHDFSLNEKFNFNGAKPAEGKESKPKQNPGGQVAKSQVSSWVDQDDITWVREGEVIMPKSIKLYQYNQQSFDSMVNQSFIETTANNSKQVFEGTGQPGPFKRELFAPYEVTVVPVELGVGNAGYDFGHEQGDFHIGVLVKSGDFADLWQSRFMRILVGDARDKRVAAFPIDSNSSKRFKIPSLNCSLDVLFGDSDRGDDEALLKLDNWPDLDRFDENTRHSQSFEVNLQDVYAIGQQLNVDGVNYRTKEFKAARGVQGGLVNYFRFRIMIRDDPCRLGRD